MHPVITRTQILDEETVNRKIRRMALEIAEQNAAEKEVVIVGIVGNGETVARCVENELKKAGSFQVSFLSIGLDKRNPKEVKLQPAADVTNKVVVLADDVANTGKTMFFALKPFMDASPKRLQTLVLVERSHKLFPVHTDYTGISIATTLQEHIAVETEGERVTGAWLY